MLGLARAKHRGLFCLHLDAWRARQRETMIPVCWWSHGTDSMAGAGWQGRRSMQAGPGDCQLTGLKCRPSASVGTVCLNPTQEGQRRDRPDAGVYCLPWPDEVSRPACFALPPLPPSAISENRKRSDGSSRARSAATRVLADGHLADCHLLPPCLLEIRGTKCPDRRWLGLPDRDDRHCLCQSRLFELCSRLEWNGAGGICVAGAV